MPREVRNAVAADIQRFYGRTAPQSLRARVLVDGEEILGIAGYYMKDGYALVFCENRDGVPKMTIWREAVKYMKTLTLPAICYGSEKSAAFLERLGWQYRLTDENGDLYVHQPLG